MSEIEKQDQELEVSIAKRWGISTRTLKNWRDRGAECGAPPPLESIHPLDLLEWYRTHVGREPNERLKGGAAVFAGAVGQVLPPVAAVIDRSPIELIQSSLDALGLSRSLARVIEEEEQAATLFEQAREQGLNTDAPRKRWKEVLEIKRQLQKGDDAVKVSLELLKEWVKDEMEPAEQKRRDALSGKEVGVRARKELMECVTESEWMKVWDRWMEEALRNEESEIEN